MNVAQRIVHVLDRKGISRNKMQADLGLSSATVYTWEKHGTTPKAETLQKIADYLGVSQEYLLTGEEPRHIISNSNIVGEISGTAAIGEGNSITVAPASDMSEDEKELLRIFKKLDRRGQNDLMHLAYQSSEDYTGYIFQARSQSTLRHRWKNYCISNGIPYCSLYELQHTFVSISSSIPEGQLKKIVGHSKSMDTFDVYGHIVDGQLERTGEKIDAIFDQILVGK